MFGIHHRARGAQGCGPASEKFRHAHFERFGRHMSDMGTKRPHDNVPLNILNNPANFEVHVYAVGFAKEDIRLSVSDDVLYINGTRTFDEDSEPDFSRQEFPVKLFERTLSLNGQVETSSITARQENGILIITLPKTTEAQKPARKITID